MRYGIKGHGMMIAVENLPKQKLPALTVYVDGDCSLEIKDALSSANDFKLAFGKNLEIL